MKNLNNFIIILILIFVTGCSKKDNSTPNNSNNNGNNSTPNSFQSGIYSQIQQTLIHANPTTSIFSFHGYQSKLTVSSPTATYYFDYQNWSTNYIIGSISGSTISLNSFTYTHPTTGSKFTILSPSLTLLADSNLQYDYTAQAKESNGTVTDENVWRVIYKKQ